MEQIFIPHIGAQKCTLILDEVDFLGQRVIEFLHDILAFDPQTKRSEFNWDGNKVPVSFVDGLTVIATTTNVEQLPKPFVNRFEKITLPDYKANEMAQILI
jgi:ATP-dependent Lon protease